MRLSRRPGRALAAYLAVAASLFALEAAGAPTFEPGATLNRSLPELTLRFAAARGWGTPEVAAEVGTYSTYVRFTAVPEDAYSQIADELFDRSHNAIDFAQFVESEAGPILLLRSRRSLNAAGVTFDERAGQWTVRLQFGAMEPIASVSYAEMIPAGTEARVAIDAFERSWARGVADCATLEGAADAPEAWTGWLKLRLADCWRTTGNVNRAILTLRTLATSTSTPTSIASLATLRLEEWPETFGLDGPVRWPEREELRDLPAPVMTEISLRAARHLLHRGKAKTAYRYLRAGKRRGPMPLALASSFDRIRLELLMYFAYTQDLQQSARILGLAAPPTLDEPSAPGMMRRGAITYARLNQVELARAYSEPLMQTAGALLDPELALALYRCYRAAGRHELAETSKSLLPLDSEWVDSILDQGLVGPSTSEELAQWILDSLEEYGSYAVRAPIGKVDGSDPSGSLAEARMAALLAISDCETMEATGPGMLIRDWPLFSSLCRLANSGPTAARDTWGQAFGDPTASDDVLSEVVRTYVTRSADFYEQYDRFTTGRL